MRRLSRESKPVIPTEATESSLSSFNRRLYEERRRIENSFGRLKCRFELDQCRRAQGLSVDRGSRVMRPRARRCWSPLANLEPRTVLALAPPLIRLK